MRSELVLVVLCLAASFASAGNKTTYDIYINDGLWTRKETGIRGSWYNFTKEEEEEVEPGEKYQICRQKGLRKMAKNKIILDVGVTRYDCSLVYEPIRDAVSERVPVDLTEDDFANPDLKKIEFLKKRFSKTVQLIEKEYSKAKVEIVEIYGINPSKSRSAFLHFRITHPPVEKFSKIRVRAEVMSNQIKESKNELKLLQQKLMERYPDMVSNIALPKKIKCTEDPKADCLEYGYSLEE